MPAVRAWRAPVAIAVAVVVVDQLTKHWAVTSLGTDREIDLVLDAATEPGVQQRDGVRPGPGLRPGDRRGRHGRHRVPARVAADRGEPDEHDRDGSADRWSCRQPDRPAVPGRRGLPAGRRRRLHRLPVVPDLQRRRHGGQRRCCAVDPQQHPERARPPSRRAGRDPSDQVERRRRVPDDHRSGAVGAGRGAARSDRRA